MVEINYDFRQIIASETGFETLISHAGEFIYGGNNIRMGKILIF